MKNQLLFKLLFVSVIFTLTSCGAIIRSYVNKDTENLPTDFGKEKSTVLVIQHKNSYNKKVESNFKKYYKGDYIMVSKDDVNTKYSDIAKYRYIFDNTKFITDRTNGGLSSAALSFHIIDRQSNHLYDAEISSGSSYKKIVKAYVAKMERIRKRNESDVVRTN